MEQSKQDQIHNLLFSREIGWQDIIYDLINTEQLDPWDIDLIILTDKYLEKIQKMEEMDFFISGKILLAATLLLKIKSEILLNKHIKNIDEILFGKKEEKKIIREEKIEFNEEIPELIPISPLPRSRKITLKELMDSLNKAINTENRRIKRKVVAHNYLDNQIQQTKKVTGIKDRIRMLFKKILSNFKEKEMKRISYTELVGTDKEEKILSFSPLLHLEDQKKIWLEQEKHFEEIYIWLKEIFLKHNPNHFENLKKEIEEKIEKNIKKIRNKKTSGKNQ